MPSFKPAIRPKEMKLDETFTIKIRVTHNRVTRYVATEFNVPEENFDMNNGKVIVSKKKSRDPENKITQTVANEINKKLMILIATMIQKCESQRNIRFMDMGSLMQLLRDKRRENDVISLIDNRIEQYKKLGNLNYKETFERTKGILTEFSGNFISFEAVDYSFLKRLEYDMKSRDMKTNSIGVHMRNIRTIYNQAITMGLVDLSLYPFRKYKIARETTRHRTLTAEEVALIYRKEIKNPLLAWSRDIFMLSFFLIGINMKDLMYLKKIEDGRINYIRSKGKRSYSIKVHPEALEIINKYHGKENLLNTLEKYADYRTATKRINKKLKDMAKLCDIEKPMTTYYMRHSWATIARSIGISKDDISLGLGHQRPSLEMTEIYVEEDQDTVDQANRQVMDHIISIQIPPDKLISNEHLLRKNIKAKPKKNDKQPKLINDIK